MPPTLTLALAATLCLATSAQAAITTQDDLNRVVAGFYGSTAIDDSSAYPVTNLTVTKDIATFHLKSGTLYATKPVEGVVATAVFIGEGTASIKPSRPMDLKMLDLAAKQHLGKSLGGQLTTAFSALVMVSFEGTLDGLLKSLAKGTGDSSRAAGILKDRMSIMNSLELPFDFALLEKALGVADGPLWMDFKSVDYGWLEFAYSTRNLQETSGQYEVRLINLEPIGSLLRTRPLIVTHRAADLDAKGNYVADGVKDQKTQIDILGYKLELTIANTDQFTVETDVSFQSNSDGLPAVFFDLRNNIPPPGNIGTRSTDTSLPIRLLKVAQGGKELPFVHKKHTVWVLPPEPLKMGVDYTYHFSLEEETIIQISSVHYALLNTYPWFPQHGYLGGQYKMDLTARTKKPLRATGSGRIVREAEEPGFNVTQLVSDKEVQFASVIFGQYQKETDAFQGASPGRDVALAVFSWPRTTFTVEDSEGDLQSVDITVPPGKAKDVIAEAKEIIKFGESLYGPFPYDSLNVAQMSPGLGFGQAPPGFVQLTGEAFMSTAAIASFAGPRSNADFFHEFFSHEIGHQWWGHVISWATDEDQWLSESFAEYTAGLYVMGLLGQDRFQGKLKAWRDQARLGDPHAPIAWANNLSGENAGSWRTGLIYNKGPYVVHMLRMQIGHENYVKAMKNLTSKYRFQQITTDHLRQEVEVVVGYKLDYFFNQWFRDTGIPTFDYSTEVKQTEDGKWLATVKISQRDKANVKIVSMPVFFHFGKDKVLVKERPILKAEDVYQVRLPEKPERISLDDHKTLLADIVAQGSSAY